MLSLCVPTHVFGGRANGEKLSLKIPLAKGRPEESRDPGENGGIVF